MDVKASVLGTVRQLSRFVYDRNLEGVLNLFDSGEDTIIVGSEAGESGRGPDGVRAFWESIFDRPMRVSFRFNESSVSTRGDMALAYLKGVIVMTSVAGVHEHPYRLTGTLVRRGEDWVWNLYHGSEPAG